MKFIIIYIIFLNISFIVFAQKKILPGEDLVDDKYYEGIRSYADVFGIDDQNV